MIYFFMLTEGANHLIGTMGPSGQAKDPFTLNAVCFSGSPGQLRLAAQDGVTGCAAARNCQL